MNEANKMLCAVGEFFFFRGVSASRLSELLSLVEPEIGEYRRGDVIFSSDGFERKLGFVIEGACEVVRYRPDGTPVPLNRLERGDSFGVLSLFSEKESFPTTIVAARACTVTFFAKAAVLELMRLEPTVAMNVLSFLADRIRFLNEKVAMLTVGSADQRLAAFLLNEYERCGAELSVNCKRTAEALGLGRASLYRALKQLVDEGAIEYDTKKIYIKDPSGLERKTKK